MKRTALALSFVALSALSPGAQSLVVHNGASVGKTIYNGPSEWPMLDAQTHWVPADGSPAIDPPNTLTHDMGHTHVGVKGPLYAELNGPVTETVSFKLFHTKGKIAMVWAFFAGPCGQQPIGVRLDKALPLVGDPNGLVTMTGTLTFDPNNGLGVCLPKHGWFSVLVNARTIVDNKDQYDTTNTMSYYSTIDLTKPEAPLNEAGIALSAKSQNVSSHASTVVNVYGIQLVEFREMVPIFVPLTKPTTLHNISYAYGYDHNLPFGQYELDLDPDLHMGVPGTPLSFKANAATGGTENFDVIDPAVLNNSTAPMGYAPGFHKLLFAWVQPTGTAPIAAATGGTIAPNILLKTLLAFDVQVVPTGQPAVCMDTTATNFGDPLPCTYPPPPTCQDTTATNFGGPLPCTYPPPPPPCGAGGTIDVPLLGFLFRLTVSPTCVPSVIKL
jgi:hypothetical protein